MEVLGPLRVRGPGGDDLTPDGGLQRRLLALLVLRRGRVVSVDAAIEALWPTRRPQDPVGALQNHVSRLRQGLPPGLVASVGDGYRLDPSAVELDADRVAALLRDGIRGDGTADEAALAELDDALERWRGPAFPELDDVEDGRAEAVRLGELRVRAREAQAEARLARGEAPGLVSELAALVDEEPLRERPRSLLMTALAAEGRRVEALRVYDDFRRQLGEEVGIEPSPVLAAQHAELLAGGAEATAASGERPGGTRPHGDRPGEVATVAPGAGWAPRGRLPVPPTSLVGRDALVEEVAALVGEHRLVSLVGPGGVGKTRLLLEVGHRLRAARSDRPVVLCELAAADEASAVDVVAAALGIDARPGVPMGERVAGVVGAAEIVVLADNCEHVLEPIAAFVDHLLANCSGVVVVATSRERLRVPGERVSAVPMLPVGDDGSVAVDLFLERALSVVPDFEPDPEERACVAEIVRRLDGLPLAIELAAARLFTHDVRAVAAGLDHRFSLLSSGHRGASRHASLGAAVSWSFGVLDPPLQELFAALSAFAGPFAVTDAAAVCGVDDLTADLALAQLTERSLVMRVPGGRFVLLETLRAFGAEQLAATGRTDLVRERHARHLVPWAEAVDRRLPEPGRSAIAELDAAVPELRAALGWLVDHGEVELAGRLVAALLDYGFLRLRPDVLAWAELVNAADPDDRSPLAPLAWAAAAYAAWMAGDLGETGRRSSRALAAAERSGGVVPAEVASICGSHALFEGRLDDAIGWYRQAVETATATDDPAERQFIAATEVMVLGYAGDATTAERAETLLAEVGDAATPYAAYAWYCAGEAVLALDPARARARLACALELAEQTGASFVTGVAGASKVSIDARLGDPVAAAADYRRLIDHWRRAGMWSTQWTMLRAIAGLLARLGRHHDAAVLTGAVRSTAEGHRIFGEDAVALDELGVRLRDALGAPAYEAALAEGAALDGDAAAEHALRAL